MVVDRIGLAKGREIKKNTALFFISLIFQNESESNISFTMLIYKNDV